MFVSFRTALVVLASLASASVAPAQVMPASFTSVAGMGNLEPLIGADAFPTTVTPTLIDPLPVPSVAESDQDDQQNVNDFNIVPGESAKAGETLTAMVGRLRSDAAKTHERECLATAIYFESKSEPLAGQLAVGEVLANRVKSGRFASSFCGVVMQRGQFSFIHGHALPSVPRQSAQWKNAVAIATIVDASMMSSEAPRALFFHARRVSPNWHFTRVATIGNHIFYR